MISGSAHERPDPAGRRAEPLITAGGAPSWSDRATSAPMPRWCGTTTAPWSSAVVRQRLRVQGVVATPVVSGLNS